MQKNNTQTILNFILVICLSACASAPEKVAINNKPIIATQSKPAAENLNLGMLSSLIGNWEVKDWQLNKNGEWHRQAGASWNFYAIQGNTAIRDEWQSNASATQLAPGFGSQLRVYDPGNKTWTAAWLSSRTRTLEFYSGSEADKKVFFVSQPNEKGRITRVIFSELEENSFRWQMQWSSNTGETWTRVYKLQATRISE